MTENAGAAKERRDIVAYIRRERNNYEKWSEIEKADALIGVLEWIKKRTERYNKKAGGLGRKKKV